MMHLDSVKPKIQNAFIYCGNKLISLNLEHVESSLTVVHAKNDGSTKKSTDCLKEEVHGEFSPALSSK